ncbi:2066_t:CDS:2 [Racocetra persica]|uniref:2066_t:CDS:1 n=1 Tax=Racocetra persica TaxID=160502 RepID=A0ACA9KME5_9GLOM|nr:2066_t:CDS:2 [Racocetra persica]
MAPKYSRLSKSSLEIPTLIAIQNMLIRRYKRIKSTTELKELKLSYLVMQSFTMLRNKMLRAKSQSLRKLILQEICFKKDNLAILMPNLEILSIKYSSGDPFGEEKNKFQNLKRLELVNNSIELNQAILNTEYESLKSFVIYERKLTEEEKNEFISLLNQNFPNIITLCYITDSFKFSSTLKKFQHLWQLQLEGFAFYNFFYKP